METRMAKMLEGTVNKLLDKMSTQLEQVTIENEQRRKNFIPKYLREKQDDWSVTFESGHFIISFFNVMQSMIQGFFGNWLKMPPAGLGDWQNTVLGGHR